MGSGQSRPINLKVSFITQITQCPYKLEITLTSTEQSQTFDLTFNCKSWGDAYAFTFMDFDDSIHYGKTSKL